MYNKKIIIVIPCFKVRDKIFDVLSKIPIWIYKIVCVDDCCPEQTGKFVEKHKTDKKIITLYNKKNLGVGGASIMGFKYAKKLGAEIIIKIDGDDQMDLSLLKKFIEPIICGDADFTKGNRFTKLSDYLTMPLLRKIGNIFLSLTNRFSSGYWNIFDTTNGYLCFNSKILELIPIEKISKDYFFESDFLNWLYIVRVKVLDIPIKAIYSNEKSNINLFYIIMKFPILYIRNFFRRFFYYYCLTNPDFRFVSFIFGSLFSLFSLIYTILVWKTEYANGPSTPGEVAISVFTITMGVFFLSYFFSNDMNNYPKKTLLTI